MRRKIIATGVLALGLGGGAFAQDGIEEESGLTVLDTITVTTPLRRESSLLRSTSSVTVVGPEEIARSAAIDLPSLLRSVSGVSLTTNGGMGARSGISLRGGKPSQTLVLINGVNVKSATAGEASLFNIPLHSIERIEIAKGAHSAQYGSDAIGGVVNIITRDGASCPTGNDICTTVTAGVSHPWGGSLDARVGGVTPDGASFSLGGRIIGTRGYNFTTPDNVGTYEPDDDGFLQGSLDFSYSKDVSWGEVYASGLYSRSRNQYDDAGMWAGNEADNDLFAGKVGTRIDHTADWSSTFELSSGIDSQRNFRDETGYRDRYRTTRYGIFASTQKSFDLGQTAHILTAGVEAYKEKVDSTVLYDETERDLAAAFIQHSLEFGALTVDGGVRYDYNEQFDDATTYNIGASYEIVSGLVARASFGTGFRAPTFNDLYWPGFGNPNLLPEESKTYEVGLRWQPTVDTTLDIALYETRLRNFFNPVAGGGLVNVDAARIRGLEASLSHRFNAQWYGAVSLDLRDPEDLTTGLDILRQERVKASLQIGYRPIEQLDLAATVIYGGNRDDNDPATWSRTEIPAHTTLDLSAAYAFDDLSKLKVSVENVFDKHYSTAAGYRSPGRTVNVSFSRTF